MVILIVEDDQWLAECYEQWLQRAGHQTIWCATAQDALDTLNERIPDVFIVDMLLPSSNGIQLLQELRTYQDVSHIPIIVCSSALPQGPLDFSPYNVVQLLDKATLTPDRLRRAVQGTYASI